MVLHGTPESLAVFDHNAVFLQITWLVQSIDNIIHPMSGRYSNVPPTLLVPLVASTQHEAVDLSHLHESNATGLLLAGNLHSRHYRPERKWYRQPGIVGGSR